MTNLTHFLQSEASAAPLLENQYRREGRTCTSSRLNGLAVKRRHLRHGHQKYDSRPANP
jgi:hypothetical protein